MFNPYYVSFDSEYNKSSERKMNVVCLSFREGSEYHEYWTNNDNRHHISLVNSYLSELPKDTVILSFATEAEASALLSLGIDPLRFKWVDLQIECKMLYNHNKIIMCGKHIQDGRKINIKPTYNQWGKMNIVKPPTNLASCLYHFLDVEIDTDEKEAMKDLIISQDNDGIEANKKRIMKYCSSDTQYLPMLWHKIQTLYKQHVPKKYQDTLLEEAISRGEYSVRTAMMVRHGLPINTEWAKNLAENVPMALTECIQDINSQFPENTPFKFDKKKSTYVMNTKVLREYIKSMNFQNWPLTDGGVKGKKEFSLALEAWEEFFNYRHDFPRGNLGAQIVRYLKLKQSLNSFNIKDEKKSFFSTVGSDGHSRPYFNTFGAQSSRSQPKSTGFLFLKGAWTRSLAQPPKGYVIGAIDYSSQEFLIGGVQANDLKMIEAYASGDVYLAYGKEIGVIPKDGTKKTHGQQRDAQKPVILGWQYWSTGYSLSYELTNQTGRKWTPEEAQPLLDKLDSVYHRFAAYRKKTVDEYAAYKYLRLPDGWGMFGDNPSFRSAANFKTQGMGAAIMRKAVAFAQDRGLVILQTLHDALYIMSPVEKIQEDMDTLKQCMWEAFIFFFEGQAKEYAKMIRMDGKIWGPDLEEGQVVTNKGFKLESSKIHIDPRSKEEYNIFSKYFFTNPSLDLF